MSYIHMKAQRLVALVLLNKIGRFRDSSSPIPIGV